MNKKTLIRNLIVSLIFSGILGYAVMIFLQYQSYFDTLVRNIILVCIAALFICVWWIFLVDLRESLRSKGQNNNQDEDDDDDEYGYANPDMMAFMEQATMELDLNGQEDEDLVLQPGAPTQAETQESQPVSPVEEAAAEEEPVYEETEAPEEEPVEEALPQEEPAPQTPAYEEPVYEKAAPQPAPESVYEPAPAAPSAPVDEEEADNTVEISLPQEEPQAVEEAPVQPVEDVTPAQAAQPQADSQPQPAAPAQPASDLPQPEPIKLELPDVPDKPDVNTVDLRSLTPAYIEMLNERERKILAMRISKEKRRRADIRAQQEAIMRTQELQLYAQAQANRRIMEARKLQEERERTAADQMSELAANAEAAITSSLTPNPEPMTAEEREQQLQKEEQDRMEVIRNREAIIRQDAARRSQADAAHRQALRTAQQEAARLDLERRAQEEALHQEADRQRAAEQALQDAAHFAYLEAERLAKEQLVQQEMVRRAQERIVATTAKSPNGGSVTDVVQLQMDLDRANKAERERIEREVALRRKQEEAARHLQELQQRRRDAEAMRQQVRQRKMAEWASTTQQFAAVTEETLAQAAAEKAARLASITAELEATIKDPGKQS